MTEVQQETNCIFFWDGRLTRLKYLMINIAVVFVGLFITLLAYLSSMLSNFVMYTAICCVYYCLLFWILTAAQIKRLHDRNRSGYWIFLLYFCDFSILGLIVLFFILKRGQRSYHHVLGIMTIPILGVVWFIVETFLIRGVYGDNNYGPDPLIEEEICHE